jgi:phage gp46-like protein
MVQDVLLMRNSDGVFDLALSDATKDFSKADGFETAIVVSFFTDARAPVSNIAQPENRRGWVGDILTAGIGRSLGSLLWLYEQERNTDVMRNQVAGEAQAALRWMVEDGVAKSVSASIGTVTARNVTILVKIVVPSGNVLEYAVLWDRTRLSITGSQ